MITKIILRFEKLEQEQQHKVLNWLANCQEKKEIPFKLFLHKGGVQNKIVENRIGIFKLKRNYEKKKNFYSRQFVYWL